MKNVWICMERYRSFGSDLIIGPVQMDYKRLVPKFKSRTYIKQGFSLTLICAFVYWHPIWFFCSVHGGYIWAVALDACLGGRDFIFVASMFGSALAFY
jgi:hypothetical protein